MEMRRHRRPVDPESPSQRIDTAAAPVRRHQLRDLTLSKGDEPPAGQA